MTSLSLPEGRSTLRSPLPLTANQRDIWITQSLNPTSPLFNIGGCCRFDGAIDIELLQSCTERCFARADALQISLRERNGVLSQAFNPSPYRVEILDFGSSSDPEAACIDWMNTRFATPFDMSGRLFDAIILRASDTLCFGFFRIHHIIADGWSCSLLDLQIAREYAHARRTGKFAEASAVRSYFDYIADEARYRGSDLWHRDHEYWRKRLDGVTPALFPRKQLAPGQLVRTRRHSLRVPRALANEARRLTGSLFSFYGAVLLTYLSRCHGADEIVLGAPFANRSSSAHLGTVGLFANLVPLRMSIDPSSSFHQIAKSLQECSDQAKAHSRHALGDIMRSTPALQGAAHRPFDAVLSYTRHRHTVELEGTRTTPVALWHGYDQEALLLHVRDFDQEGDVLLDFELAEDVFDADRPMEHVVGHFDTIMRAALGATDAAVSRLPMLTPAELRATSEDRTRTEVPYPSDETLHGLFEKQVMRTPDAIAVVDRSGVAMRYSDLDRTANRLARALRSRGIGPDDRVAVMLQRGPELLVALFAVLKAGGAYVPIDTSYPESRISFLLEDCRAKVVLTQARVAQEHALSCDDVLLVDRGAAWESESAEPLAPSAGPTNLAYVIYTSGSTGNPKGAMIEHHAVVNRLTWMQKAYPIGPGDTLLQKTPFSFDVSVWELFWWSFNGASLALLPPGAEKEPAAVLEAIERHRVTAVHFVPSMLGPFLDALESSRAQQRLDSLKYVFASGEALSPLLVTRFRRLWQQSQPTPALVNLYGPTEATVDVSYFDCPLDESIAIDRVPIGRPIDNIRLYVLSRAGLPQPVGHPGELCIAGVGLARGYLDRAELTAEKFVDNPGLNERVYRTGDLARLLSDGNIEYLGRLDGQVKVRGNRVELGEIEAALGTHPSVSNVVVTARDSQVRGLHICAYYVSQCELDDGELRGFLATKLPDFMVPAYFVRLDAIPLTPNGKTDRRALPDPTSSTSRALYLAPRNRIEAELTAAWKTVLGVEDIGVHDDFFALGGDSIVALLVRTEAAKRGLSFALTDLLSEPTIAGLAAHAVETQSESEPVTAPFATLTPADRALIPESAEDAHPATTMQLAMLFHSREREHSAVYHDVFQYTVAVRWDEPSFRDAMRRLVARHQALRASFDLAGYSVPLQVVHREATDALEIVDARGRARDQAERELNDYITERRYHRYDVATPPLYQLRVHVRDDDASGRDVPLLEIVFSFHHALLDGWSVATLMRELMQDYLSNLDRGLPAVEEVDLPRLSEMARLEEEAIRCADAAQFFASSLRDVTPARLDSLRLYQPEPVEDEFVVRHVEVDGELEDGLRALARAYRVSIKSVLFAAYGLTLQAFMGRRELATGLVLHGRPERAHGERLVGLFLNTVPIRVGSSSATWLDAILDARKAERDVLPYRRYPFARIQADFGATPLLHTAFNYVHFHVYEDLLQGPLEVVGFEAWEQTNFELLFNVVTNPRDKRLAIRIDGKAGVLEASQIDLFASHYLAILRQFAREPNAPVDFSSLVGATSWSGSSPIVTAQVDVVGMFEDAVKRQPAAAAATFEGVTWTYAELDRAAVEIGLRLLEEGVGRGALVGLALDRSLEMIAAIIGILKIGATCVPLDVSYPVARLTAMVDAAKPSCVVVDRARADTFAAAARVLVVDDVRTGRERSGLREDAFARSLDQAAYVLFTSGSTGTPKGVAVSHRALANLVVWQNRAESGSAGTTLQFAPLSFDVSFQEILSTLTAGGRLLLTSEAVRRDQPALLRLMDREGVDRVIMPYVALEQLAEVSATLGVRPRQLRTIVSSGEQLRITSAIRAFCRAIPDCIVENQYGPTETHVVSRHTLRGDPARWPALPPIGTPIDGATLHVLDPERRPVPLGAEGELYVSGVCLALGYLGRPELTEERFVTLNLEQGAVRAYRTGDRVRMLASGEAVFLGRTDSQVKVRGHRVETSEVELAIMKLETARGVREVAVVVRKRASGDSFLAAFFVGDAQLVELTAIGRELSVQLPQFMIPSHFEWIEAMPKTPSGKRDDAALRSMPVSFTAGSRELRKPRTEHEQALASMVESLLEVSEVSVDDDFFQLGGTSISAMRLVVMVEHRYKVALPLSAFVTSPTIARLAELLSGETTTTHAAFDPLVPIRTTGSQTPMFLIHPIGGSVLCYVRLARAIDEDRPIYALQAPGMSAHSAAKERIEELAELYAAAIREACPQGPYVVGGWSFGGHVAFEVARILVASGNEVSKVILLDAIGVDPDRALTVDDDVLLTWFMWELLWIKRGANAPAESIPPLATRGAKLRFVLARAKELEVLPEETSLDTVARLFDVFRAHWRALASYRPEPLRADVVLLRASDALPSILIPIHEAGGSLYREPTNGWAPLVTGNFEVIDIPGDHLRIMEEPHVGAVGRAVNESLAPRRRMAAARSEAKKAVVMGAGIGGLTAAIALRRAGFETEIYERAGALTPAGTGLSVMSNAIAALRTVGISGELERRGQVMRSFTVFTRDRVPITTMPFAKVGDDLGAPSVNIHRADLQAALLEKLRDVPIHLSAACDSFALAGSRVVVSPRGYGDVLADVVVGADGIHSATRRQIVGNEPVREAGYVCWLATTPFSHPRLEPGHVAHYWGRGERFGLIDIGHGRAYWWGTKNIGGRRSIDRLGSKSVVAACFDGWPEEVMAVIDATDENAIVTVPAQDRPFATAWGQGPVTLLGDAAHPMLSSLGQGAGMAIEDAVVLGRCLAASSDISAGLRAYELERIPRTRQVARLSRTVSMVEQLQHPALALARDTYFRLLPQSILYRQNASILRFEPSREPM